MRILALGDIVGHVAIDYLAEKLWAFRAQNKIDFCVANGENATEIRGISAADAEAILGTGVDLITLGNHAFGMKDIYSYLDANEHCIIRPANYPTDAPGVGYTIFGVNNWRVLCINVSGRVYLDPLASPFDTVDRILDREAGRYDVALLDIHAEATSEKLAIGRYFDGRVQVMFGTHTHVPTADEQVLPLGSGYITDLGMCGPQNGILGTDADAVIHRFRTMMPTRFSVADGPVSAQGVIFDVDEGAGKVRKVTRVSF
ncbi:MAG: YmdB family metallophosphoesterase [Clostridia bacterium]|nr:YmdB family metallophosphoesterase [Clostridia bacterium]